MNELTNKDMRAASVQEEDFSLKSKIFEKYKYPLVLSGIGLFIGGSVALGVMGGVLSGFGTKLGMDRLKDSMPELYNWILEHPGTVEVLSMVAFTGAFGLTLGGVFIGLIANFTTSYVLDVYAESGLIPDVERLTLAALMRKIFAKFKALFITVKAGVKEGVAEFKKPIVEAQIVESPIAA
jgi:hypothetical protein